MSMHFWLEWFRAFFIVIALLMVGVAVHEYILWKREDK